ncbi:HAD-IA family hydrolase [Maricaulis sp.]|uniref:HAD-IA family hydrolase n=1 Tax=Maricaulis sp. TaxID=1486257 RepID=UPI00262AE930|nr:HAD-IA family hydrolase [Maricaulis sp.]
MTSQRLPFKAILFDMDGVLVDSNPAIEASWQLWAGKHGLDFAEVKARIHGRKAVEVVRHFLPGADIEAVWAELIEQEMASAHLTIPIPGIATILSALQREEWAVVTSAPLELAQARMTAAGHPQPVAWVTARDVERGKPAPDGFLMGAEKLGVAPADCLVIEDAGPGIAAARAAGMRAIYIHAQSETPAGTTAHITGHDQLSIERDASGAATLRVAIR